MSSIITCSINKSNRKTRIIDKLKKRIESTNSSFNDLLSTMNKMQICQQMTKRAKIEKLTNDELSKNNEKYNEKNNNEKNDENEIYAKVNKKKFRLTNC